MSDQYVGEIRLFAFPNAPTGWLACNGQMADVNTYQTLFVLLGTIYGGDGVKTFGLPNLNGRVPIGSGLGPNLTARTLGQNGGTETVVVTQAQVPPHTHGFQATTNGDSTGVIGPTVLFGGDSSKSELHYLDPVPSTVTNKDFATSLVSSVGGDQPHPNEMPSLCINYCICFSGVYPQKSN